MWIYFSKGIYADFAINIYYFLIAVYGYIAWTRAAHSAARGVEFRPDCESADSATEECAEKKGLPITHVPPLRLLVLTLVFATLWGAIYFGLRHLTDSTVPVADAFTTALSIVAMWMLARKYIEQWIAWMLVDAVCVCLYAYKGIPLYAVLYAAYTVIALIGYRNWLRLMRRQ